MQESILYSLLLKLLNKGDNLMSKINYREDQIPIINYEGGTMAVPAVPGAGKTFIVTNLVAKAFRRK